MSDDVFHSVSMIMNVDPAEIAKIVHDYIERGIGCDYDIFNSPPPPIYIGPVKIKTLKERLEEATMHEDKEETKMNATSVQKIENVKDISFIIEEKHKLSIVASTNDDIFKFDFEGPEIIQQCKASGLFTGWEKGQKIKELENQNKKILDTNHKLQEKIFCKDLTINELEKELSCWRKRKFTNEEPSDNVNHPSHYTGRYECIDVMQDVFGDEATDNFCLCNAFKYIWRSRKKNGLEDVKKAVWYLNKYIEEAENGVQKGEQI